MRIEKATADNGDTHVLRNGVSIAIFQSNEDADLFLGVSGEFDGCELSMSAIASPESC